MSRRTLWRDEGDENQVDWPAVVKYDPDKHMFWTTECQDVDSLGAAHTNGFRLNAAALKLIEGN